MIALACKLTELKKQEIAVFVKKKDRFCINGGTGQKCIRATCVRNASMNTAPILST